MQNLKIDSDLQEMIEQVLQNAKVQETATFDEQLWQQLDELGLIRLTGAEENGGSGASWAEAKALHTALAKNSVRGPFAEHDLLAGWLADLLGFETAQIMTACELTITVDGVTDSVVMADRVPWASQSQRIVAVWQENDEFFAQSFATSDFKVTAGFNNIGESRDRIRNQKDKLVGVKITQETYQEFQLKRAMIRAIQVSAALEKALEDTIEHVSERKQFGRPLAKFQAVQHLVADIASETALSWAATDAALLAAINSEWRAKNLEFLVAVARSSVGHSASMAVRAAHQAHGAIGTTKEHRLHHSTRAALAWRGEYGSVESWDKKVMNIALEQELWPLITG